MSVLKTELSRFKAALLVKQAGHTRDLRNREEIRVEHNADEIDEALRATERELVIAELHRAF